MKKILLFIASAITVNAATAQSVNVTLTNKTYQQNFNTLEYKDTVGTALPNAWYIYEAGDLDYTNDEYYTNVHASSLGTFSLTDNIDPDLLPSYVPLSSTDTSDHALGSRAHQQYIYISRYGAKFHNDETDSAITYLDVTYKGETWYQFFGQDTDSLIMYYSKTATGIDDTTAGVWMPIRSLSYPLKDSVDLDIAFQYNYAGNLPGNFKIISGLATTGINVLPGEDFYLMWQPKSEIAATTNLGGIDDLDITFGFGVPDTTTPPDTDTNVNIGFTPKHNTLEASLYPTVAHQDVKIKISASLKNIGWYMTNAAGQRLMTGTIKASGYGETTETIDVRNMPAGAYFIYLQSDDDKIRTLRFVKE